jgi:secretion/DNA translocation related TadE-like protein
VSARHARVGHGDRGSASIWTLSVGLLIVSIGATAVLAGSATIARHEAQAAADLGALAGAVLAVVDPTGACDVAATIVESNNAEFRDCRIDDLDVIVTAAVDVAGAPAGIGPAVGSARAGPLRSSVVMTTSTASALLDGSGGYRRDLTRGRGARVTQRGKDSVQDPHGIWLGQRLVAVAALRRLHA